VLACVAEVDGISVLLLVEGKGVVFAAQSRIGAAIEAYEKALAIKPDYADAARNLVQLPIGSIDKKIISRLDKQFSGLQSKIDVRSQSYFLRQTYCPTKVSMMKHSKC